MYNLPNLNLRAKFFLRILLVILAVCLILYAVSLVAWAYFPSQIKGFIGSFKIPHIKIELVGQEENKVKSTVPYVSNISYEQAIIDAAKNVSPSVVSIVISKNMPVYEEQYQDANPFGDLFPEFNFQIPQYVQKGSKLQEVGSGSGFIASADGLVVTNKHVVYDDKAEYTVITNDGTRYKAKVLAIDPVQDLAVIKIQSDKNDFIPAILGDSDGIQIGQTVIAIGNALGQFSNTVSVGVVSGLGRTISASDQAGSFSETLEGIIQTDAAINSGNSGGPLVNLKGEVIGVDVAVAQNAQNIGFALPVNLAKKDIEQVVKTNKITYPFLGVKYTLNDDGALVSETTSGSAAERAGIKAKDII
jgi:serine protease Do